MRKKTRGWKRCICGALAAVMTVVSLPMVSLAEEDDRVDQALVVVLDQLIAKLNETGGDGYQIDELPIKIKEGTKDAIEDAISLGEVITGAEKKNDVVYISVLSLSTDWDSGNEEAWKNIDGVSILVVNENKAPKKYAVKVDGGERYKEVSFDMESASDDVIEMEGAADLKPEKFDLRDNRIQTATGSDAEKTLDQTQDQTLDKASDKTSDQISGQEKVSVSRHKADILTSTASDSDASPSEPEGALCQYNETSKVVSGVLPINSLYRVNFGIPNVGGGEKLYVSAGDGAIRYIFDNGQQVAYCHNPKLKGPAPIKNQIGFFQRGEYNNLYFIKGNTTEHSWNKKITVTYDKEVTRDPGYIFNLNKAGKKFDWEYPMYFKKDYQEVIVNEELNTTGCPNFGGTAEERQKTADKIINLLYAGYPFDARGAYEEGKEKGLTESLAYNCTQYLLWSICGDDDNDGIIDALRAQTETGAYMAALEKAIDDDSLRKPTIRLIGDTTFSESEGVWKTETLEAVGGFGGSFYIEGMPKEITIKTVQGTIIRTGRKGTKLKPGDKFYLESDVNPAEGSNKEISFYMVYNHQNADIAYYKFSGIPVYLSGNASLDKDYQDLVRVFPMKDGDVTSLKAVFTPGESPEVTPDPGHEPGTEATTEESTAEPTKPSTTEPSESGTESTAEETKPSEAPTEESTTEPTKPSESEPTEPESTAPSATEPTKPETTVPSTTEPTEPETTVPSTTAPTEPETTVPSTTEPETTAPNTTAPTEPETTAPSTTVPTEPETTAPSTTAPTEPETTAPSTTAPTEPETTAPSTTAPTEPETSVPSTTAPTEPETTVPNTTAPTESETIAPSTTAPTESETIAPSTTAPTEPETTAPTTAAPTEPETTAPTTPSRPSTGGGGTSSGGGPNGFGGDSTHGPGVTQESNPENPDTIIITDNGVPLAMLPENPVPDGSSELIELDDGNVPLAGLPKTGDHRGNSGMFLLFSGFFGGIYMMLEKKRKKAE